MAQVGWPVRLAWGPSPSCGVGSAFGRSGVLACGSVVEWKGSFKDYDGKVFEMHAADCCENGCSSCCANGLLCFLTWGTCICKAPQFTISVDADGMGGIAKDAKMCGVAPISPIPCFNGCGFGPCAFVTPFKVEDLGNGEAKWVGNGQVVAGGCCPCMNNIGDYGINNAIIVDNTGVWRDEEGLSQHLKSKGVAKVILTAPGKGDLKNIVAGINSDAIEPTDRIISAASCTTNAIVPPLKAIDDEFGIVTGHVETVHAYTNDQNLIDNYHKGSRRGRSAPLNMVITETGAAKAVSLVCPEVKGKLTGMAFRVPTPTASVVDLTFKTEKSTSYAT